MLSKIVILCVIIGISISQYTDMKVFDKAGNYTLEPHDYNYRENVIVELYSAGSGSSFMLTSPSTGSSYKYASCNTFCAGTSGGYVKINISTNGNETLYFTLGKGGFCNLTTFWYSNGEDGGYSILYNKNWSLLINITGGISYKRGVDYYPYVGSYLYNISRYRAEDTLLLNVSGIAYPCVCVDMLSYFKNGPSSYNGPYGGSTYNFNESLSEWQTNMPNQYGYVYPCDGYMGSGAGYGCNFIKKFINQNIVEFYKGGDGALILYY